MPNYAEYFEKVCYKPTWFIGDRVFGKYKKVPYTGTVGNDTLVNELDGPIVTVFLDLPIKINNGYKQILFVKPRDLKRLKSLDDPVPSSRKKSKSVPKKPSNKQRSQK